MQVSRFRILFERLVFSNIYVSAAAVCMTFQTVLVADLFFCRPWALAFFIFFSTLFTYNFQRLVRIGKHTGSYSNRLYWMVSHRGKLTIITALSFIGIATAAFYISFEALLLAGLAGFISLAYVLPVFKFRKENYMFRDIPFFKIFLISFTWTIVTVWLPYEDCTGSMLQAGSDVYWIAVRRFLFIFSITLPFDIRDMKYDREAGLKTIPLQIGVRRTKLLAILLQLLAIFLSCAQYYPGGLLSAPELIALIFSYLLTIAVISMARVDRPELYFSGLLEGTMILQFLLIYLSNIID